MAENLSSLQVKIWNEKLCQTFGDFIKDAADVANSLGGASMYGDTGVFLYNGSSGIKNLIKNCTGANELTESIDKIGENMQVAHNALSKKLQAYGQDVNKVLEAIDKHEQEAVTQNSGVDFGDMPTWG